MSKMAATQDSTSRNYYKREGTKLKAVLIEYQKIAPCILMSSVFVMYTLIHFVSVHIYYHVSKCVTKLTGVALVQ